MGGGWRAHHRARGVASWRRRARPAHESLTLRGATLGDALLTLMRAIDPNRPEGGLLNFGLRAGVGPVGAAQGTVAGPRLNLSLGRTTVFEALNALAQAAGVSWALRYELAEANAESAAITLLGARRELCR